jgi:hypothetical protein
MGSKAKLLILTALSALLILGFQNCSSTNSPVSFTADTVKFNSQVDSGTPYEGKIYALVGNLCADGTEIHSQILLSSSTQAQLNRENCQNIAPVPLTSNDFAIDRASDTLTYQNQSYVFIGYGSLGITNFSMTNDANNFYYSYSYEGQPSWLQIFLDTDNNPATGFSYNGIGADYMIENDNVWKYSAATGAPADTWAWTSIVSANKNNVAPNVSWSFPKSAIGSPTIIKLMGQTSFGARTSVLTQIPK